MTIERVSLPLTVRRWLDRSLPEDAPVANRILNRQEGEIEVRGRWLPFMAETLYQLQPLSFVWKARLSMMPGVWVAAEDGHDAESGWGWAKLWGILSMGANKAPEVRTMQLVRSLAELPWKPQFALSLPGLEFSETSETSFNVRTMDGDQEISVAFELDGSDDLIQASSKRHYDVPDGFVEVPWRYEFSDHREIDGLRVPASAVATYEKPSGPWEYWRGTLTLLVSEP